MLTGSLESNNDFPDELLVKVFKFLPSYQYIGQHALGNVCTKWHSVLRDKDFTNERSYQGILAACRKNPDIALHILNDPSIREHILWKQLLEIAGCHSLLTIALITTPGLIDNFPVCELYSIAGMNVTMCNYIIGSRSFDDNEFYTLLQHIKEYPDREMLSKTQLMQLNLTISDNLLEDLRGRRETSNDFAFFMHHAIKKPNPTEENIVATLLKSENAVKNLLANPEQQDNLSLSLTSWIQLGHRYTEVALRIIKDPKHQTHITASQLITLGVEHKSVAEYILSCSILSEKLTIRDVALLTEKYSDLAEKYFTTEKLIEMFTTKKQMFFGFERIFNKIQKHYSLARQLLTNPVLNKYLHFVEIKSLCKKHPDLISYVLDSPLLLAKLKDRSLSIVAEYHIASEVRIINTPNLFTMLNEEEQVKFSCRVTFAQTLFTIAQQLMKASNGEKNECSAHLVKRGVDYFKPKC